MLQIDMPIGKIARKLSPMTDELIFYGKPGKKLYMIAVDASQTSMVVVDVGLSFDSDLFVALPTKELAETSKGIRYFIDFDENVWKIQYESDKGVRVKKKIMGFEPSTPGIVELLERKLEYVGQPLVIDYASLSSALEEFSDGEIKITYEPGEKSRVVISSNSPGKEVEAEIPLGPAEGEGFTIIVSKDHLKRLLDVLENLSKSFKMGVTENGVVRIETTSSTPHYALLTQIIPE